LAHELVNWLYGLQRLGVKLGLEGIGELLRRLGRPDRAYPCVLVGGTNGKGSVSAMLDAILAAHGLSTGLYTSPHLVRPNERIRVGSADVSDGELAALLREVRAHCEAGLADGSLVAHPSFFEVMTAAALQEFRAAKIDAGVIEVGLGGRLDATNAIDPAVSVVVTVDLDHTAQLGGTLGAIAAEKAAIARPGRPLVIGVEAGEAFDVLRDRAAAIGAMLVDARRVAHLEDEGHGRFAIATERARHTRLTLALEGAHQRENARVAVVAAECAADILGLPLNEQAVRRGLEQTRWPGRLQWLAGTPPLLLDGAHNAAGALALARWLDARAGRKPVLVFAAMRDKDLHGILRPLASRAEAVVCTRVNVDRAATPESLASAAALWNPRSMAAPDVASALAQARASARECGPHGYVLVAGSLYLVGEVLALAEGTSAPGPVAM
jgi:dihydrofolate synthase/folylpolyglutamate synthase